MWTRRFPLAFLAASAILASSTAYTQDSQSIADAARQARQQKQQHDAEAPATGDAADATPDSVSAKTAHVITNDEIPEHAASITSLPAEDAPFERPYGGQNYGGHKTAADQWKQQILTQKRTIASLERQINNASDTPYRGNCLRNCTGRYERAAQRQDQAENLKEQLSEQKQRLEDMQESARRQGYGSSVWDP